MVNKAMTAARGAGEGKLFKGARRFLVDSSRDIAKPAEIQVFPNRWKLLLRWLPVPRRSGTGRDAPVG